MRGEVKVGLFAVVALLVIAYATIRVSDRTLGRGGSYDVTFEIDSAIGLTRKTPVEIAGIQVGVVHDVELIDSRRARLVLRISKNVRLGQDTVVRVRSKGFLGDTYIELLPGSPDAAPIEPGGQIPRATRYGDISELIANLTDASQSLKEMLGPEDDAPVRKVVSNLETITEKLATFSTRNEENLHEIVRNLAIVSRDIREVTQSSREDVKETLARISSIAEKIDKGQGTLGRLVNEDETIENINDATSGLASALGSYRRTEMTLGYHLEYLGQTVDFKHYVDVALRPTPDKAFLFEFIADPAPSPTRTTTTTTITSGGTTNTVTAQRSEVEQDALRISAQLAKSFYDLTLRGGIIESHGGMGLDYALGPATLQFSAFDFDWDNNQRPHLKGWANLNLTGNLYLVGGVDDFISKTQKADWFFGAGFRLVDEDLKSLISLARLR